MVTPFLLFFWFALILQHSVDHLFEWVFFSLHHRMSCRKNIVWLVVSLVPHWAHLAALGPCSTGCFGPAFYFFPSAYYCCSCSTRGQHSPLSLQLPCALQVLRCHVKSKTYVEYGIQSEIDIKSWVLNSDFEIKHGKDNNCLSK